MKNIPRHIGVILDGNRRWAKDRGLPTLFGHRKGLDNVKKLLEWVREREIGVLTIFVFSTENWNRSKLEINYLMKLLWHGLNGFKKDIKKINQKGIRLKIIGDRQKISPKLLKLIQELEKLTKNNGKLTVNVALSYGGRAEIASAMKKIIEKKIAAEAITEKTISDNLWTRDLDFLIRTGKEQRISNFLIWQAAYAELYFSQKYWPDFTEKDLDEALDIYNQRKRRHGV